MPYIASPQPGAGGGKKKIGIIAGIVAVLAIGAGAAFVLTRDDDKDAVTDETEVSVVDTEPTEDTEPVETAVETTAAETTVAPTTTVAPETTIAATTTTVATIPAGALDLGYGVYIPMPDGWTMTNDPESVLTISDGTTSVAVQVLARTPGENPAVLVQEYIDTFDNDFESVGYSPSVNSERLESEPAVDVYSTFYLTYDAAADFGLAGQVNLYVRGDGLSLLYDVFGPSDQAGSFPTDAADMMRASFQQAQPVDTAVPLVPVAPFRVTSVHPFVQIDGLVGFSAAPGFEVISSGNNRGFVSNGTEDFQADKVIGQPDTNAVVAAAQAVIAQNYTGVANSAVVLDDPDSFGVIHGGFTWTGTYVAGNPSAGGVDFYYDPASTNAYIVYRTWFTGVDGAEPFPAHAKFMLDTVFSSFTTIP